jgi:hypothetical protein
MFTLLFGFTCLTAGFAFGVALAALLRANQDPCAVVGCPQRRWE